MRYNGRVEGLCSDVAGAERHAAVLDVSDADVVVTGPYQGRPRLTLTYPIIDRARHMLWVVTGTDKVAALEQLRAGSRAIPGGRVRTDSATILADRQAAPLA